MVKNFPVWSLAVLYGAIVSIALIFAHVKIDSLGAGVPADYTYYMQFADSVFTKKPESLVPIVGTSVIYSGFDAKENLHAGIHFEPIKYISALVYKIFQTPFSLFAFYIFLFFTPLLYAAFLIRYEKQWSPLWLPAFFYGCFPPALSVSLADLRPFSLLIAFSTLFLISILYRRPIREQVFFLVLLLLTREEALYFAFLGIAGVWASVLFCKETSKQALVLSGTWLLGFAIVVTYMLWIRDFYEVRNFSTVITFLSIIKDFWVVFGVSLIILAGVIFKTITFWRPHSEFIVQIFFLLIPVVAAPLLGIVSFTKGFAAFDGRYGMLLFLIFLVCVISVMRRLPAVSMTTGSRVIVLMVILSGVYQVISPISSFSQFREDLLRKEDAALMHDVQNVIDNKDFLIVDNATQQVFYNRERFVLGNSVFGSSPFLGQGRVWIVVKNSPQSFSLVTELMHGVEAKLVPVERNSTYSFYAIQPN